EGARDVLALRACMRLVRVPQIDLARGRVELDRRCVAVAEVEHPGEIERDVLFAVLRLQRLVERAVDRRQVPVVLDEVENRGLVAEVAVDRVLLRARRDDEQRQARTEAAASLLTGERRRRLRRRAALA